MKKKTSKRISKTIEDIFEGLKDDPEYMASGYMIHMAAKWITRMNELDLDYNAMAEKTGKSKYWVKKMIGWNSDPKMVDIILMNQALGMEMKIDIC